MKKEFIGYIGGDYDNLGLFKNKEDSENPFAIPRVEFDDLLKEFKGRKISIIVDDGIGNEKAYISLDYTIDNYPNVYPLIMSKSN